jgi:hypothetical protein
MKNYVFVYYDNSNAEASEEVAKAWGEWFGQLGDKVVDAGNPFASGGKAVEKSGVTTIENFPATGYTIVKANSLDEAVEMAQSCPLLGSDSAAVRVYETLPM